MSYESLCLHSYLKHISYLVYLVVFLQLSRCIIMKSFAILVALDYLFLMYTYIN